MKRFQSILFLLLCFVLGVGLALAYRQWRTPREAAESMSGTGIGDAPPLHGFSLPSPADASLLRGFPPLHATAVAVNDAGDPKALTAFVRQAHALHLQVVLLPPAKNSAVDPYPRPLAAIAEEARAAEVDVLCISWLNADPDPVFWQGQIAQVRKAFPGRILLAAQPDLLPGIEFWGQVDLIGAIGPFDLGIRQPSTTEPISLHDVRIAWASYLDSLESLSFRYGKRLVLLNIEAPAPSAPNTSEAVADPDFSALTYEALATETKGRTGTEGLFLNWAPNGSAAAGDPRAVNHDPELLHRIADLWLPGATSRAAPADADADTDDAGTDP